MRARRVDQNQADMVAALRFFGASVAVTSVMGEGFPDLLVGWMGETYLIECKNGERDGSKPTPAQERWFKEWRGRPVFVAHTTHQALAFVFGRVIEGSPWKKGGGDVQV